MMRMSRPRLAILSTHTSPLAQPGLGDGGGMNVYVRALAGALARAGVECDVLTRAEHPEAPMVINVEPGFRVVHIEAGPRAPIARGELHEIIEPFTAATLEYISRTGVEYDAVHANYWVSGGVGHALKHVLDLPLVVTFHTLDRVKADAGIDDDATARARVEREVVRCADMIVAPTYAERRQLVELYGAEATRIDVVPPGVDHSVFSPGNRGEGRGALGLDDVATLLFVGRIQPLKGAGLAVRALSLLDDPSTQLVLVGGPSGVDGDAELARLHDLVDELGLRPRVRFVAPQPHDDLVTYYRAADVCLVPSRSESFGMVALEAAASGTPVVAANVGGLRTLVDPGRTGYLIDEREAEAFADPVQRILDEPELAARLGRQAVEFSEGYAWNVTAARLRRLYGDLMARSLVNCA